MINYEEQSRRFWGRWSGLDLCGCDPAVLADREAIERYIIRLCELLEFKRFGDPTIVRFGVRPEIAGYSFTQLIETSLVSGHLVDASRCGFIDIFSCSAYSVDAAQRYTREYFSARQCIVHFIDRLGE